MLPVLLAIGSFFCGAILVFFVFEPRRVRVEELERRLKREREEQEAEQERLEHLASEMSNSRIELDRDRRQLVAESEEFKRRVISYDELDRENRMLKVDLKNQATITAKQEHDIRTQRQRQEQITARVNELGRRYMSDTEKWIERSLTPNNYASSKTKLQDAIESCRAIGVEIGKVRERELLEQLQKQYELAVRASLEREEQARIRAQIRDEQQREKEIQRALEQAEREKRAIEVALDRAMKDAAGKHSAEIDRLKAQLAEAEAKSQRTMSQAQLTKAGNVYVISNIGSFGEGVFKIGMTRRLEPMERVIELGDASVPFPFDVHMMIATDNAPELEKALHRAFYKKQLNKVNPRKEFFRCSIDEIVKVVRANHGDATYTADPEALQYYESLRIKPEEQEVIEQAYDEASKNSKLGEFVMEE